MYYTNRVNFVSVVNINVLKLESFLRFCLILLNLHAVYTTANYIAMEYKQLGDSIERAYQRIKPHVFKTPLMHSPQLSQKYACQVHLKLESEQKTGDLV